MTTMSVRLRGIAGTGAALGLAGSHPVVVDRPDGKAGGQGLGFNGGQLLAMAIGGCFWNDMHYVADEMGIRLESAAVDVTVIFEGTPLRAVAAVLRVSIEAKDADADIGRLIHRAETLSTVSNSITRGFPVTVGVSGEDGSVASAPAP